MNQDTHDEDRNDSGSPEVLSALSEVSLPVEVRVGKTEMTLRELRECDAGTVLSLGTGTDELVDLFIGGQMVARGELVAVDAELGIRIVEVVDGDDEHV